MLLCSVIEFWKFPDIGSIFFIMVEMALSKQCKALTMEWKVALIKVEKGGRRKTSIAKEFTLLHRHSL